MPNDTTLLTVLLQKFIFVFLNGATFLVPAALLILTALATIEFTMLGVWIVSTKEIALIPIALRMATVAFFAWLIVTWPVLSKTFFLFFIRAGLAASGGAVSETDFSDPGNIALYGMSVTAVVFAHIREYAILDALKNIVDILFTGWAALAVVFAYFALGVYVFLVTLEFYAVMAVSVILLPFGINKYTAFIAEKVFAAVVGCGVEVLMLSFLFGSILPVMVSLQTGMNPDLAAVLMMLLGAMAMAGLSWRAHKLANTIQRGAAQLSLDDVRGFVSGAIGAARGVGGASMEVGGAVGSAFNAGAAFARRRA